MTNKNKFVSLREFDDNGTPRYGVLIDGWGKAALERPYTIKVEKGEMPRPAQIKLAMHFIAVDRAVSILFWTVDEALACWKIMHAETAKVSVSP